MNQLTIYNNPAFGDVRGAVLYEETDEGIVTDHRKAG